MDLKRPTLSLFVTSRAMYVGKEEASQREGSNTVSQDFLINYRLTNDQTECAKM